MNSKIQLQQNAGVFTADGKQVGHIERVVMDPSTHIITDIVIRTGTLFNKEEKVVPMDLIAETTEKNILLSGDAEDPGSLPPFEEKHYAPAENGGEAKSPAPIGGALVFGSPIITTQPQAPIGDQFAEYTERNIPEGTIPMKEGAKVLTVEGKHVGNVERVLADSEFDQVTHLLVSNGLIAKEKKLVPISWVMSLGEEEVLLRVKKPSVEKLEAIEV